MQLVHYVRAIALLALAAPAPLAAQMGDIEGRVTDTDGIPVSRATVLLVGTDIRTETDAAGRFRLSRAPAGRHELRVSRLGLAPVTQTVEVPAGGTAEVAIELTIPAVAQVSGVPVPQAGRIRGIIHTTGEHEHADTTIAHEAVVGAAVRLLETAYQTQSDERGGFVLGAVPPGTYVLEVRRLGFRPTRQTVRVAPGGDLDVALHMVPAPITMDAVVVEALVEQGQRTYELSSLQKVPPVGTANVTTVTLREIRQVHARDPWELVREATGLEVHEQGQGPGFASDAVIRGFTSDHSADVALVVDGVPINEPINGHGEGYADWNLLFPGALADLQVVKGPISLLFGNFAAGGAVNVTTRASADQTAIELDGGSHGYAAGTLTTGFERGGWGGFFGARGVRSSGWRDNSGYHAIQAVGRGNRRLSPVLLVDVGAQYYSTAWDSPGYLALDDFNAGLLTGAADPTDGGDKARLQGRLSAVLNRAAFQWHTTLWGYRSRWHLFLNIPELGGEGEGLGRQTEELDQRVALGGRSIAKWTTGPIELIVGAEGQYHTATYDIWATTERRRDLTVNRYDASFTNGALLSGVVANLDRALRLEGALRADILQPRTTDQVLRQPLPAEAHRVLSPKLGAVWYVRDDLQLYGSAARGFRSAFGFIGDPTRQPVTVWALEGGGRYASRWLEGSLAFFRLETTHERLFNPITLRTESDGRSIREGFEVELELRPAEQLALATHWTVNTRGTFFRPAADTIVGLAGALTPLFHQTGGTATTAALHEELPGERVPAVAEYSGRVGLAVRPGLGVAVNAWVTVMGPYVPLGEPDQETRPYAIANLKATVPFTDRVELAAGVDNLLNVRAPELRASGAVNPVAPRTLHLSLHTQW
jgi:outer membrane receptor protein involved in Fe transport